MTTLETPAMMKRAPEQLRLPFPPRLHQLVNSALAADSMMGISTDDVRPPPPRRIYLRTTGKSVEQIVREFAQSARRDGHAETVSRLITVMRS